MIIIWGHGRDDRHTSKLHRIFSASFGAAPGSTTDSFTIFSNGLYYPPQRLDGRSGLDRLHVIEERKGEGIWKKGS